MPTCTRATSWPRPIPPVEWLSSLTGRQSVRYRTTESFAGLITRPGRSSEWPAGQGFQSVDIDLLILCSSYGMAPSIKPKTTHTLPSISTSSGPATLSVYQEAELTQEPKYIV
ncbi:hypothetical protein MGG_13027 [Pyricularia oryzae 70-15]|uniref:Uncharacterized protein n=1 Tax=Pyricularia oryzae (strain 70-15 / ATCC MYA-4617 / FGSC 8958) TaxID=242507 RepID=G4MKX5_PYRO7|nr:uncharacterized protein MGG_13027 [Pyricularia oryzae 70-15]EHA57610.1 hypothetical protein MGG_13027 [Pyricularia oryzae 70-15]